MDTSTAYTVTQAAAILGINETAVRHRIRRGAMQAERIAPRLWLIPHAVVEEWRALGKIKSGRPRKAPPA